MKRALESVAARRQYLEARLRALDVTEVRGVATGRQIPVADILERLPSAGVAALVELGQIVEEAERVEAPARKAEAARGPTVDPARNNRFTRPGR